MHEHFNLRDGIDVVTFSKKMLSGGIYHKVRDSLPFCTCISLSVSVSKESLMTKKILRQIWLQNTQPGSSTPGSLNKLLYPILLIFLLSYKIPSYPPSYIITYLNVLSHDKQYYKFALPYKSHIRWVNPARWFFLRQCLPPYRETRC